MHPTRRCIAPPAGVPPRTLVKNGPECLIILRKANQARPPHCRQPRTEACAEACQHGSKTITCVAMVETTITETIPAARATSVDIKTQLDLEPTRTLPSHLPVGWSLSQGFGDMNFAHYSYVPSTPTYPNYHEPLQRHDSQTSKHLGPDVARWYGAC